MHASNEQIHKQGKFVEDLSGRLAKDVSEYSNGIYDNHTRIQDDIKRLRRELLELGKMFNYDWDRKF